MSTSQFRRGFKTQAESLSLEIRAELGLGLCDPLDPRALAEHLAVPIVDLTSLAAHGARAASIAHFQNGARGEFSGATVFRVLAIIAKRGNLNLPVTTASFAAA
jgi:hypothetical protein